MRTEKRRLVSAHTLDGIALLAGVLLILLRLAGPGLAQTSGGYNLIWHTVAGGGATSSAGGGYRMGSTIGQAAAGTLRGGSYAVAGGFRSNAIARPTVYLPLVRR